MMSKTLPCVMILATLMVGTDAHGAMMTPRPRSSHNQILDANNRCGSSTPYSKVSRPAPLSLGKRWSCMVAWACMVAWGVNVSVGVDVSVPPHL